MIAIDTNVLVYAHRRDSPRGGPDFAPVLNFVFTRVVNHCVTV